MGVITMTFGNRPNDKTVLKDVNKRLMRMGTQSKVTASVRSGAVTLTGTLQFENQRRVMIRAANQVSGVRNVVDQMTVKPKQRADADPSRSRGV